MPWMNGIPHDQGLNPQGTISPKGVVAHRTFGSWEGDYAVGKGTGGGVVGFHFLIGKAEGKWCQFYDSTTRCAHGGSNANANDISVAIEVEGRNEDVMTDWQVRAVRQIVDWLEATHGIAKTYRFSTAHNLKADHGYIPHSAVAGSDHSDYWTVDDWQRLVGTPLPTPRKDPDMILVQRKSDPIYLVGVTRPVYVASLTDLDEVGRALREPGYVAQISDAQWNEIVKTAE